MKMAVRADKLFFVVLILTICSSAESKSAFAQVRAAAIQPAQVKPAGPQQPNSPQAQASAQNATGEKPAAKKETPAQKKLKLLLAAKFDRTAPAVLKAWSYQDPGEETKKEDPQKRLSGKIVNAYESFVVFELDSDSKLKPDDIIDVRRKDEELGTAKVLSVDGKKIVANLMPLKERADTSSSKTEPGDNASPATSKNESQADAAGAAPAGEKGDSEKNESAATPAEVQENSEAGEDADGQPKDEASADLTKQEPQPGSDDVSAASKEPATSKKPATREEPASQKKSATKEAAPKMATVRKSAQLNVGDAVSVAIAPQDEEVKAENEKSMQKEVADFVRSVTLGQWDNVKTFLAEMKPDDADKVYAHVLKSLATGASPTPEGVPPEVAAQMASQMRQNGQVPPSSFLTPDDILQLSESSPKPIRISLGKKKASGLGDGISGKWKGELLFDQMPEEMRGFEMELTLNGGTVTGTISVQQETVTLEPGTYDKSTGALSLTASDPETGQSAQFNGTVENGKLTGSMSSQGIAMNISAELIEPAADVEPDSKDEAEEDDKPELPPGVQLPPGMTIDDLPPEALAELKKRTGMSGKSQGGGASHIGALSKLIRNSKKAGHDFSKFVEQIEAGTTHFGSDDPLKRLTAADLLMQSGLTDFVEQFLPSLDEDGTKSNLAALKLWSQLAIKKHGEKRVAEWLEKAWMINQIIVGVKDVKKADKDKALSNLIELSPQVEKDIGVAWMNASFTEAPERGMLILTNLGTKSATMADQAAQVSEQQRLKLLRLQNEAVEKLIQVSPETAANWDQALTLLAQNWLKEAETSIQYSKQNSRREYMQIDMYGNYYWVDQDQWARNYGNSRPRPIKLGDMLEVAPSESWRERVSSSLQTQFRKILANLHLRVNEEDKAFPFIEEIADAHPAIARDLIHEFLRIWTKNHDPNTDRRQRNPYIYFYGFDQKAEAIPLTRSKQERNLQELAGWVERIRKMPIEDIDEKLLANAFTTCHSSAEVFQLDRVRSVFGELENLKPDTVAAICQKMRENLSSNWRDIRQQEAKQTNRREPEVQQEVLRGYAVARELALEALGSFPDSWELHLALACLMYDENAYSQTVQKSSEFSDKRDQAFAQFQIAAAKYTDVVATLEEKDQATDVYDFWFYAGLGACDLGKITDKTVPDLRQYKKIRAALDELPGSLSEIHLAKFANNLFTRMSPIKPEIKFRYLRGGFEIVGDHPRAWEASNLYDYYKDLVSEIKLDVAIDGDDNVGHEQPFGVFVNILHTSEIERESGGFGKYVQNQNSMMYAYNYGRPTEDYRDKFADTVNQALGEHFEILNVTFQSPDTMKSRPASQAGWRVTPYAYVLLKPLGSQVDRIAPLKLDLDFLDTSGYVVIPIESPAVVVDASSEKRTQRPITDLQITQTLDERQANEGKLIVEITATGRGLVPNLEEIIDLKRDNFELVSVDDQGVLPSAFDKESDEIQIVSDRSWTVEYKAIEGNGDLESFSFGETLLAEASNKFQRYDDADLVEVQQTVSLEKNYASFSWKFLYWLVPLIVFGLVGIVAGVFFMKRVEHSHTTRFRVPEDINPFTVLTLLNDIKERNGINTEQATELQNSINRVEEYYFGDTENGHQAEDLEQLAETWVNRAT